MKRSVIRELKKTVSIGLRPGATAQETDRACAAALELLHWSIKCGHGRLAILRLEAALKTGARVPGWQLRYCRQMGLALQPPVPGNGKVVTVPIVGTRRRTHRHP